MNVLVVEDDDITRRLLEVVLEARGHDVTSCSDAASGLREFLEHPFPLVVTDWLMPGEDGLALVRAIRLARSQPPPVILVQTARDEEYLDAVLEAGADDYLPKPYTNTRLEVRLAIAERLVVANATRQRAEEVQREAARIEGVLLAANTVEHYLGNQLALTVGYTELLGASPFMVAELRPLVEEALGGALLATETLNKLRHITRLEKQALGGPTVLDLERSAPGA